MSNLLPGVPRIVELQRMKAQGVEAKLEEAIQRMQIAAADSYNNITVVSIYWKSDDTGGAADSDLFIQTLSQLQNVQTHQRSLSDQVVLFELVTEILRIVVSQSESRRLFILHYAGPVIASSTSDSLTIAPKIGQELDSGSEIDMSYIKDGLKDMASKSEALDVLLVMDSCRSTISGRSRNTRGARVELMAAPVGKGVSNSKIDGRTFT